MKGNLKRRISPPTKNTYVFYSLKEGWKIYGNLIQEEDLKLNGIMMKLKYTEFQEKISNLIKLILSGGKQMKLNCE